LREIIASSGVLRPIVDAVTQGGESLEGHSYQTRLPEVLRQGAKPDGAPWDVVVLQEKSDLILQAGLNTTLAERSMKAARTISTFSRMRNPAVLMIMLQAGLPHPESFNATPENRAAFPKGASDYAKVTEQGCRRIMLGLRESFAGSEAQALACPAAKFWAAMMERYPGLNMHDADKGHPGPRATWLSALALAGTIGGRECIEKANWLAPGVSADDAKHIKALLLEHPEFFTDINAGKSEPAKASEMKKP
jgi:hypothetical protein